MNSSNSSREQTHRVGVFWDIENVPVPRQRSGTDVVNALHLQLSPLGQRIQMFACANLGNGGGQLSQKRRGELSRAGVRLHDAVRDGKDVADKLLVADIMDFALDFKPPATIVLISGDVDFAIVLARLKLRGYRIVLVLPSGNHVRDELKKIGDLLYFIDDVLSPQTQLVLDGAGSDDDSETEGNETDIQDIGRLAMEPARRTAPSEASLSATAVDQYVESFLDILHDFACDGQHTVLLCKMGLPLREKWPTLRKGKGMIGQLAKRAHELGLVEYKSEHPASVSLKKSDSDDEDDDDDDEEDNDESDKEGDDDETDDNDKVSSKRHIPGSTTVASPAAPASTTNASTTTDYRHILLQLAAACKSQQLYTVKSLRDCYRQAYQRELCDDLGVDKNHIRPILAESSLFKLRYRPGKGYTFKKSTGSE